MATPAIAATTATVTGTVNAIAPGLVNVILQNVKYPFEVGDNVKKLQLATKELLAKREDVKIKKENGERQGERVKNEVSDWMEQVGTIEKEVEVLDQKYQSRYQCLGGFHFNCWSNYSIGKSAAEKLLEVQNLCSRGAGYDVVTIPAPPPLVQEVSMEPTSSSTANDKLREALECINNELVGVIGLLGMGGVGKTHLLKMINNNYVEGSSDFNVVVMITASKECSIAKLQASIVEELELAKGPTERQQARIIFNFLHARNFLLLLDDMWEGVDLQGVGIPFPLGLEEQYKRKVVITTRSVEVCGQMEVRKEIKVACLNKEESFALFLEKVGGETIHSNPLIPSLAQKVVDELGGLPLALITIGRAMHKKTDPDEWEYAIDQLRAPNLPGFTKSDGRKIVFEKLKLSYENLGTSLLKKCFLSCSMWPEDYYIDKKELIKNWIGLGYIQESNIQESYKCGHAIIGYLLGQCLLEEAYTRLYVDLVRMHDVIRDMAHWIACDFGVSKNKWVIKAGERLQNITPEIGELWRDAECISFNNNMIDTLSCSATLSSPSNLTSLMLGSNHLQSISNISYLTRLQFLDLSLNRLSNFPLEICKLISLRYLDLSCNFLPSIPTELKSLIHLKFLFLRENRLTEMPDGVISELQSLEELDLYGNFYRINNLENTLSFLEELQCLKNLKALGITVFSLPELEKLEAISITAQIRYLSIFKLINFTSFPSATNFCCSKQADLVELDIRGSDIQDFVLEGNGFPNLESLYFDGLRKLKLIWRAVLPMDVFPKLKELTINDCNLEHITWIVHLPCLQLVHVACCLNLKELITSNNQDQSNNTSAGLQTFPSLKVIHLMTLVKLERMCDPGYCSFPSLRYLTVHHCPILEELQFPNGRPPNLEIRISSANDYRS